MLVILKFDYQVSRTLDVRVITRRYMIERTLTIRPMRSAIYGSCPAAFGKDSTGPVRLCLHVFSFHSFKTSDGVRLVSSVTGQQRGKDAFLRACVFCRIR